MGTPHSLKTWKEVAPELAHLMVQHLRPALQSGLVAADDKLFNLAENGHSSQDHIDSLRILRHNRASLVQSWAEHQTGRVLAWGRTDLEILELSLVGNEELEEQLALQQMAEVFDQHCSKQLETFYPAWIAVWKMSKGIDPNASLGGTDENAALTAMAKAPLHARGLSRSVGDWLSDTKIPFASMLVILKTLEREIVAVLPALLAQATILFKQAGWPLGHLPPELKTHATAPAKPANPIKTSEKDQEQFARRVDTPDFDLEKMGDKAEHVPRAPLTPDQVRELQEMSLPQIKEGQHVTDVMADALAKAFYRLMGPGKWRRQYEAEGNVLNQEIGEDNWDPQLGELMEVLRHRRVYNASKPRLGSVLPPTHVKNVLQQLQREAPPSVKKAARDNDGSLAQQFKMEMIELAKSDNQVGSNPILDEMDEDAVDVVGMVFEVFLTDRQIDENMREKIADLIAPYVKVAIDDRKMFMHRKHPARRLLDAIAAACEGNNSETLTEKMILEKVTSCIDTLTSEFHEDMAVFETAEQEIQQFVAQQKSAMTKKEKKQAEIQQSADKIERAEKEAQKIFIDKMKNNHWPVKTMELLRGYWTQYYKILMLQGSAASADPARAQRNLQDAVGLLNKLVQAGTAGVTSIGSGISKIHADILIMLGASGLIEQSAHDTALEIWGGLDQASQWSALARSANIQSVVSTLTERPAPAPAPPPAIEVVAKAEWANPEIIQSQKHRLTAADFPTNQDLIDYFTNMPMGTWVDFVKEDGSMVPAKLSWVSPISMRLMFVTHKGYKHAVESSQDLAVMVKRDRLRLREYGIGEQAFESSFKKAIKKLDPTAPNATEPAASAV